MPNKGVKKTKVKKDDLQSLIKQNIRKTNLLLAKVDELDKDFKRFEIVNFIRFLIVVIPLILAVLYLIPIFREFFQIYEEFYKPLLEVLNNFGNL